MCPLTGAAWVTKTYLKYKLVVVNAWVDIPEVRRFCLVFCFRDRDDCGESPVPSKLRWRTLQTEVSLRKRVSRIECFPSTLPLGSISAALSCPVYVSSGEERGLFSRTAAGNRAYTTPKKLKTQQKAVILCICVENIRIIVTLSISKSLASKMISVHIKTQSWCFQIPPIRLAFLKSSVFGHVLEYGRGLIVGSDLHTLCLVKNIIEFSLSFFFSIS